jgi:hypothetical protein
MGTLSKIAIGIVATLGGFYLGILGAYLAGYTEKEVVMSSGFGTAALLGMGGLWIEGRIRSKLPRSYQWVWLIAVVLAAIAMSTVIVRMIS